MSKTFLILIDGPMGSGKTTTSKLLNQSLPDTARVALPDIKRLVPNFREDTKTLNTIREVMRAMIETYLKNDVSVVVEQITKTDGAQLLKEIAERNGASFYGYRLTAPKEIRWNRVLERTKGMMEVTELPQSKIDELAGYFEPNHQFYIENPIEISEMIDTNELDTDQAIQYIINSLTN